MEGAGAWKAERERPNQNGATARPAYRIISTEWLGLQSLNLLQTRIGHCAGLTGAITGASIVGIMLRIRRMHCWQFEWRCTGRGPTRRWRLIP